jgi:hypothetical protein
LTTQNIGLNHTFMPKKKEPRFVSGTLKWCNKMREKAGKRPLKQLPKGGRYDTLSCPCGKATGLHVGTTHWGKTADECDVLFFLQSPKQRIPKSVQQFVEAFDEGQLPQYDVL